MMDPVRRHSIWVWLVIILIGWALLLAAPKTQYGAWLNNGQPYSITSR